jgi:hypothetical protein
MSETSSASPLVPRTVRTNVLNPYPGPRPFKSDEYRKFAGRDDEISELSSLVISHPVVLLYAQSGAGKTSLLNAGLSPTLTTKGVSMLPAVRVGAPVPRDVSLAEIVNIYAFNAIGDLLPSVSENEPWLRTATLTEALSRIARKTDDQGDASIRVVAFDQFEELFSTYPQRWQDRREFFQQVTEALRIDQSLRVLFVLREDYWASFQQFAVDLPEGCRTQYHLERLREPEALQAITRPLEGTRWAFGDNVAESLVRDLMTISLECDSGEIVTVPGEFVEPVQLQVVCYNLFEGLPPTSSVVSMEDLRAFGNPDRSLQLFYENAVDTAVRDSGFDESDLRVWFEMQLITPAGTRGLVFQGRDGTGGIPNEVLDILEAQHLVRPEIRSGSRWYELTHDRFIRPIQRSNLQWKAERWSDAFETRYNIAIQKAVYETKVPERTLREFLTSLVGAEGSRLSRMADTVVEPALAVLRDAGLLREETRGNQRFYTPFHDTIAQAIQQANQNWQAKHWSRARGLGRLENRARRWARAAPYKKPSLLNRSELRDAEEILRAAKLSGIGVSRFLKELVRASREAERNRFSKLIATVTPPLLGIAVVSWALKFPRDQGWLFLVEYSVLGALGSCAQLILSAWSEPQSNAPLLYLRDITLRLGWSGVIGVFAGWGYSGPTVGAKGIAIAALAGLVTNLLADQLARSAQAGRPTSLERSD